MRPFLKAVGYLFVAIVVIVGGAVAWLALRSPEMRPASPERVASDARLVARGEYLFNHASDCVGCHSDHFMDRWGIPVKPGTEGAGGLRFEDIPGVLHARNITPDPETGIGRWTDGEIIRAIREGVTPDGRALFPVMPYSEYRSMSDDDAKAIVAYIRSLKPVRNHIEATSIDFPVNLMIKFVPKPVEGHVAMPDDAKDHHAYGKYLATIGGCSGCHTPRDSHGKPIPGREFAGGNQMRGPWGNNVTANLTPDPHTFMGTATKDQFIARFKAFKSMNAESAPKSQPGLNTVMPWIAFAGMTEQDLGAIYDYLKTLPPVENHVVTFPDAGKTN